MFAIPCKACQHSIRREAISVATRLAKCERCDAVFRLRRGELPPRIELAGEDNHSLAGVSLRERSNSLTVEIRWFSVKRLVLCAIPLCVEGSLILLGDAIDRFLFAPFFVYAFSATICLLSAYGMIATLWNTTRLRCTDRYIRVRSGPLPWGAQLELDTRRIAQLYVPPVYTKHAKAPRKYQFALWALTRDGHRIQLLSNLRDKVQARTIERKLEDFLGIIDVRVPGEVA